MLGSYQPFLLTITVTIESLSTEKGGVKNVCNLYL